ncbi:hypothetical protein OIU77_023565 [Salix suchowensis]|uniref:HEAT SHOCK 22 kDa PROTEIN MITOCHONDRIAL-LIKE n=2 Tax=Salix TaxID=40685 RepID=A0A9Q0NNI1_SALPP|nr:small heat shock protein [Salix suchowensis]KAJ6394372.1 hypothetical protein OIU77_023565 [Salix suchowensis]KAJ6673046.1 HEAT SHOCK 22 KDA PROTEIN MITOCHONDRIAL-LIKE [Salix purpurea]
MAASIALRRGTASPLLSKLINPVRSVSTFRSFNTDSQSQVTTTGGNSPDDGSSVELRGSSGRSPARRRDATPSFFSDAFDPFSPTRSLSKVLNLMDQFLDNPFLPASRGAGALLPRRGYDVKEDENSLYIFMDMPGLSKEDVKVTVEQNTLVINGEESKEGDESGRRYSSRLELPSNQFMLDEIKGEMKNGVLKLEVPKVKEEVEKNVHEVKVE